MYKGGETEKDELRWQDEKLIEQINMILGLQCIQLTFNKVRTVTSGLQ